MIDSDNQNSDEEGFVPNRMQIKSQLYFSQQLEPSLCNGFQPHYILGTPILKKEPNECYLRFNDVKVTDCQSFDECSYKTIKTQKRSAFQTYNNSEKFRCIYSRFKNPFKSGIKSTFQNQIVFREGFHQHFQPNRALRPWLQQKSDSQSSELEFDSRFEGGNLLCAFKHLREPNTYTLFMQNDTNTYGYNQWFNFSIKNSDPKIVYTFKIVNFKKKYSFFKRGMRPTVFSLKRARDTGNGWTRNGYNIIYYQSNFVQEQVPPYYTLQFQIQFEYANDYVAVSSWLPYTYSRLTNFLGSYEKKISLNGIKMNLSSISKTLGGNAVPHVTLSLQQTEEKSYSKKPAIVIFGRQHSGEVWSSFLIQQLLEELNTNKQNSRWLLERYQIHIFPMINVDGVIYGNFRCDIAGYDLNRCWKDPSPSIHPQIYNIKEYLMQLLETTSIEYCFDFHTHSKQFGIFSYCCVDNKECRSVPLLISKMTSLFRYKACTFGISAQKRMTARGVLFQMTKNVNIITIQMSSYGMRTRDPKQGQNFTIKNMNNFAKAIIDSIYHHKNNKQFVSKTSQLEKQINYDFFDDEPVSGSDSDPQADQIATQVKLKKLFPKSVSEAHLNNKKRKRKVHRTPFSSAAKTKAKTQAPEQLQGSFRRIKSRYNRGTLSKQDQPSISSLQVEELKPNISRQMITTKTEKINKPAYLSLSKPNTTAKGPFFSNKPPTIQKQKTPLNLFQFSLKKLPIFASEALPSAYQGMGQNHSLMMATMGMAQNRPVKHKLEKTVSAHSNFDKNQKRVIEFKLTSGNQAQIRDIPFLCVMSDTKKSQQLQRIKERKTHSKSKQHWDANCTQNLPQQRKRQEKMLERLARQKRMTNCNVISKRMMDKLRRNQL